MMNKWLFTTAIVFLFTACKKDKEGVCLKSIGSITQETRTISNAKYLDITDRLEIIYHQDSLYKIELIGGSNLLPGIITKIEGETLKIYNANTCNWWRKYNHKIYVHIHLPDVKNVQYSGSGTFKTDHTLIGDYFSVDAWNSGGDIFIDSQTDTLRTANHAGAADFYLSGTVQKFYCYTGGNGFTSASLLNATDAFVNNSGTGDLYIRASNYMELQLFYTGNIFYYGHPVVLDIRQHDSGKAILAD